MSRPKGALNKNTSKLRRIAQKYTKTALKEIVSLLQSKNEMTRLAAAKELLDRGHGRPAQAVTGADGVGPVSTVVEHVYVNSPPKEP